MRVIQGHLMLLPLLLLYLLCLPPINAQLPGISARSLDALLQDYAFRAFVRPRTGITYDTHLPSKLTGIKVSAMRLRSGSLRKRGVHDFKEFQIPIGVIEQPFVHRLVLVYHNLGNWSSVYYNLPGYSHLTPIVGLLAYNASNSSAKNLPELDIRAYDKPILIKFENMILVSPNGSRPLCVFFDLHGSVMFDNVLEGNVCSTIQQGHFSIVVESNAPPPAPSAESPLPGGGGIGKNKVWIIVGSSVGGLLLLFLLALVVVWIMECKNSQKIEQMQWGGDVDEALRMKSIGNTKAPLALGTRTQPVLESEYLA